MSLMLFGYAESKDGIVWEKCGKNPVFTPDKKNLWERAHVAGCQVIQMDGWYYMFYIGYEDLFKARICLARSKDGVSGWERHPMNLLSQPDFQAHGIVSPSISRSYITMKTRTDG